MFSYDMGHGKIPLFSLWKGVYLGNRSQATSVNLQETYGGNFPKDPEIGCGFPFQPFHMQYRKGVEMPLADVLS